ncbi:MAG: hypothetical protein MZV65_35510 [Chromatiales bacterium]|nr:hypothetical protein [Chromatiales bacterium]
MSYKHWRVEDDNNIATVTLDAEGASANTLSREVLEELEKLLDRAERARTRGRDLPLRPSRISSSAPT